MKIKQAPKEFLFLTNASLPIEKEQEKEILAYSNIITDDWEHHTFKTIIKRDHLFIRPLEYSDVYIYIINCYYLLFIDGCDEA